MQIRKRILHAGVLLASAAVSVASGRAVAGDIYVGGLFDLTGETSSLGAHHARAIQDYIKYVNEQGGVSGHQIKLVGLDYAYNLPKALEIYKTLTKSEHPALIFGYGTADTMLLSSKVTDDRIPYFSASYSALLADGKKHPYNFFVGTTYSDQARVALRYLTPKLKASDNRKPLVSFVYPDNAFGTSPLADEKAEAAALGVEVGPDLSFDPKQPDYEGALRKVATSRPPDLLVVQGVVSQAIGVVSAARKLGYKGKIVTLCYGVNEQFLATLGPKAQGVYGVVIGAMPDELQTPGVRLSRSILGKEHPESPVPTVTYLQSLATAMVAIESLKRAKGDYSGQNIKKVLESISGFELGGLTSKVSFTPEKHNGTLGARVFVVEGMKYVKVSDEISGSGAGE